MTKYGNPKAQTLREARDQQLLDRLHQMVEQIQGLFPQASRGEAENLAMGVMSLQAERRGLIARNRNKSSIDRAIATLARLAPDHSLVHWADQGVPGTPTLGATPPQGPEARPHPGVAPERRAGRPLTTAGDPGPYSLPA